MAKLAGQRRTTSSKPTVAIGNKDKAARITSFKAFPPLTEHAAELPARLPPAEMTLEPVRLENVMGSRPRINFPIHGHLCPVTVDRRMKKG
jgi:hypothetical protein